MANGDKNAVKNIAGAFKRGSLATRLSFFIMGAGHFLHRRYVKGALYLAVQVLFFLFMISGGAQTVAHLFSGDLGTRVSGEVWNEELQIFEKVRGDNSFLVLLYGVAALLLTAVYLYLWYQNVLDCYKADVMLRKGERLPTAREEALRLINERFHIPLLLPPLLGLLVFTVLPLVFMVLIAFTNYDYAHMPPGKLSTGWACKISKRFSPFQGERLPLRRSFCGCCFGRSFGRFWQRLATILSGLCWRLPSIERGFVQSRSFGQCSSWRLPFRSSCLYCLCKRFWTATGYSIRFWERKFYGFPTNETFRSCQG